MASQIVFRFKALSNGLRPVFRCVMDVQIPFLNDQQSRFDPSQNERAGPATCFQFQSSQKQYAKTVLRFESLPGELFDDGQRRI
jgi:hypothetical protein